MKSVMFLAAAIAATSVLALGHNAVARDKDAETDEQTVRQIMQQYTTALIANDAATLEVMWAPEYTFVTGNGAVVDRAQRLEFIRAANTHFESITSDEETVCLYGDTAVVVARTTAKGQGQGRDLSGQYRGTTVLVKQQGQWRMVLQQTNLIVQR